MVGPRERVSSGVLQWYMSLLLGLPIFAIKYVGMSGLWLVVDVALLRPWLFLRVCRI